MRILHRPVALLFAWLGIATSAIAAQAPDAGRLAGRVLDTASPLPSVQVYAYQLVDRTLRLATTTGGGEFFFDSLPAGLYKVIALKRGFVPAVVMLTRASREAAQWVELQLVAADEEGGSEGEDFWSLREQVPADVLREIDLVQANGDSLADSSSRRNPNAQAFLAQMTAETGTAQLPGGLDAALAGGEMRLRGQLLGMRLSMDGDFRRLATERFDGLTAGSSAQDASLVFKLAGPDDGELDVRSRVNRLSARVDGQEVPIDFANYGLRWSQAVGRKGESAIVAQYTEESGFHTRGWAEPAAIPIASRSFRLEGSYRRELGESGELRTAVRYRERTSDYAMAPGSEYLPVSSQRQFEAYGGGDVKVGRGVDLHYGLLGGLREGSVALTPRAGAALQLGELWKGRVLVSRRFDLSGGEWLEEFLPMLLAQDDPCEAAGLTCYELELSRGEGDSRLALGAAEREYDRTVRMYFSDDFFDHLDSLFLVPGDRVPELKLVVSQRLGNHVVTRLESTAATGGGGTYLAADRQPYRNSVAYLVTSLETQFSGSSTGVLVAFQRLQQDLEPMLGPIAATIAQLDLERLQLTVTQDLNVFFDLPADWAMRINMELTRGSSPFAEETSSDAIRRRLTTGVSVRF